MKSATKNNPFSARNTTLLFVAAFAVRALVMFFLIQPNQFYKQADSSDYHNCAYNIATGNGMFQSRTHEPIFWRTPGYPPYLAFFYWLYGTHNKYTFEQYKNAQELSLWVQIAVASTIPIIVWYCTMAATGVSILALIMAIIAVFHPGMVLASTYLLTEGLALILFYLFLWLFSYYTFSFTKKQQSSIPLIGAIIALSLYTWMRPMGEFIGYFSALLVGVATIGSVRIKVTRAALFGFLFFLTLFPWYQRNHRLTGEWFFCPTIGTYLNCFSVPKILRRTLNKPIEECLKIAQQSAAIEAYNQKRQRRLHNKYISHNVCKNVAFPVVKSHPWFFIYDWTAEVIKTTFDLYSYQIIPMIDDTYWYDPIEEYLPHKIADCLYAHRMPWYGRMLCWAEFIFSLLIWFGIFGGLWVFLIRPLITPHAVIPFVHRMQRVWLFFIPLIGITVGMTGGFGYARLRLPAEPLILILSLTFFYWIGKKRRDAQ